MVLLYTSYKLIHIVIGYSQHIIVKLDAWIVGVLSSVETENALTTTMLLLLVISLSLVKSALR